MPPLAHISDDLVTRYRGRLLLAPELVLVHDHLAGCEPCREKLATAHGLAQTLDRVRAGLFRESALEDDHLAYEQLAGLADDALGDVDQEIARSHLEVCEECGTELTELRRLRPVLPPRRGAFGFLVEWPGLPTRGRSVLAFGLALALAAAWLATRTPPKPLPPTPVEPQVATAPSPAPSGSPSAATLTDAGTTVSLDRGALLATLDWLPSREAVADALTTGRLPKPRVLDDLAGRRGQLLGVPAGGSAFGVVSPLGRIVRVAKPTLEWRSLDGAESYVVAVFDSEFQEAARSEAVRGTQWTVREPLPRGKAYTWELTAFLGGREVRAPQPPEPEARFLVLHEVTERELRLAETRQPRSHLALGVLYARAGLVGEAKAELRALVAANPGVAPAGALLRSVESWR